MVPSLEVPHSCTHCAKILLAPFLLPSEQDAVEYADLDRVMIFRPLKPDHERKLQSKFVAEAAKEGCSLCQVLDRLGSFPSHAQQSSDILAWMSPTNRQVRFRRDQLTVEFEMLASPDDEASKDVQTRPINIRTSSDETLSLARRWLEECLSSHPHCGPELPVFKPTRLVQIIPTATNWYARLIRPASAVRYVALSYCWGGPQTTLSKDVEKSWEVSIAKDQLPRTIQDAVYVTMKIGLEYIWIDSLCIVQEDSVEKAQEIAKMVDVYGSATFTLAASRAASAREGFLQDRRVTDFPKEVFSLPYKCSTGQISKVTLFRRVSTLAPTRFMQSPHPLGERGWAFQERWLSPRFLDFTNVNMQWTCLKNMTTESGITSYTDGWRRDYDHTFPQFGGFEDPLYGWRVAVHKYTMRKLSVSTDRILALSGIAQELHPYITSGAYWAGLWESEFFPMELMWQTCIPSSRPGEYEPLPPRPTLFQGPSWSWVSVNSNVFYNNALRKFTSMVKIERCEIELFNGAAPYGAVTAARLCASGLIQKALLLWNFSAASSAWGLILRDEADGDVRIGSGICLDALEAEYTAKSSGEMEVYLLEVLGNVEKDEKRRQIESCGLILRKHSAGVYSRLGSFWLTRYCHPGELFSWFRCGHETRFMLI